MCFKERYHQAYVQENVPLPYESAFVSAHKEDVPPPTVHTTATDGGRAIARGGRGRKGSRGRARNNSESANSIPERGRARSKGRGGRGGVRASTRGGRVPNEHTYVYQNPEEITVTQSASEASQRY
jgi:hypothetical protein